MDMYLEYLKKIAAQMSPATVNALQSIDSVYKEKLERKEEAEQLFDGLPLSDTEIACDRPSAQRTFRERRNSSII